ncbi:hypothetical protein E2C01_047767 [Portunus trituberculatus]|uniref:Uncharacterized protein n=1 Tax=Portunus trituberculatus TaxID=210409 RepID=A0A5B7GBE5_PORTR|nr:hypothetical protein [Portunus trituberculatus]
MVLVMEKVVLVTWQKTLFWPPIHVSGSTIAFTAVTFKSAVTPSRHSSPVERATCSGCVWQGSGRHGGPQQSRVAPAVAAAAFVPCALPPAVATAAGIATNMARWSCWRLLITSPIGHNRQMSATWRHGERHQPIPAHVALLLEPDLYFLQSLAIASCKAATCSLWPSRVTCDACFSLRGGTVTLSRTRLSGHAGGFSSPCLHD